MFKVGVAAFYQLFLVEAAKRVCGRRRRAAQRTEHTAFSNNFNQKVVAENECVHPLEFSAAAAAAFCRGAASSLLAVCILPEKKYPSLCSS